MYEQSAGEIQMGTCAATAAAQHLNLYAKHQSEIIEASQSQCKALKLKTCTECEAVADAIRDGRAAIRAASLMTCPLTCLQQS